MKLKTKGENMQTINVTFTVSVPKNATRADITEWLHFVLGHRGDMQADNPLCTIELEATSVTWRKHTF